MSLTTTKPSIFDIWRQERKTKLSVSTDSEMMMIAVTGDQRLNSYEEKLIDYWIKVSEFKATKGGKRTADGGNDDTGSGGPLRLKALSDSADTFIERVLLTCLSGRELIIFANELAQDAWNPPPSPATGGGGEASKVSLSPVVVCHPPIVWPHVAADKLNIVNHLCKYFKSSGMTEEKFVAELQHFLETIVAPGWRSPPPPVTTTAAGQTSKPSTAVKYPTTRKPWSCKFCHNGSASGNIADAARCKNCGLLFAARVYQDILDGAKAATEVGQS
jgi:hypothetical protein